MEKRCDGCGERPHYHVKGVLLCGACVASVAQIAGITPSDQEREVLRLAREWSASRRGDEQRAPVDVSSLVAAVMRLEG